MSNEGWNPLQFRYHVNSKLPTSEDANGLPAWDALCLAAGQMLLTYLKPALIGLNRLLERMLRG